MTGRAKKKKKSLHVYARMCIHMCYVLDYEAFLNPDNMKIKVCIMVSVCKLKLERALLCEECLCDYLETAGICPAQQSSS